MPGSGTLQASACLAATTDRPAPHLDAQQLLGGGRDALLRPRRVVLQVESHVLGRKVQLHLQLCKEPAGGRARERLAARRWLQRRRAAALAAEAAAAPFAAVARISNQGATISNQLSQSANSSHWAELQERSKEGGGLPLERLLSRLDGALPIHICLRVKVRRAKHASDVHG